MSEQFSKKLFTLNLYISNTLQKVLQNKFFHSGNTQTNSFSKI